MQHVHLLLDTLCFPVGPTSLLTAPASWSSSSSSLVTWQEATAPASWSSSSSSSLVTWQEATSCSCRAARPVCRWRSGTWRAAPPSSARGCYRDWCCCRRSSSRWRRRGKRRPPPPGWCCWSAGRPPVWGGGVQSCDVTHTQGHSEKEKGTKKVIVPVSVHLDLLLHDLDACPKRLSDYSGLGILRKLFMYYHKWYNLLYYIILAPRGSSPPLSNWNMLC